MTAQRRPGLVMLAAAAALLIAGAATAGESTAPGMPEALRNAAPNTFVKLCEKLSGKRSSPGLVYLDKEGRFLLFGGQMERPPKNKVPVPHTELLFDMEKCVWENFLPADKLGVWGERAGPVKAVSEVLPSAPYAENAYAYHNYAYDPDRGVVLLVIHTRHTVPRFTLEFDLKTRQWTRMPETMNMPPAFWEDVFGSAMCYDPVNKEVLGVQGRWAYRDGKWSELKLGSELVNGLREKARVPWLLAKRLVGACRARYYLAESPEEEKCRLDAMAGDVREKAEKYLEELAKAEAGAADAYAKKQLGWARASAAKAIGLLKPLAGALAGGVSPESIVTAEDARDALAQIDVDLAVAPPKRMFSQMAYDAKHQKIVLFGGHGLDRLMSDTWVYDCKARRWMQGRPERSPSPRCGHGLVWLPDSGKVLLVDGLGDAGKGELWVLDVEKEAWSLLAGEADRKSLTGRPSYGQMYSRVAAAPGDVVLLVAHLWDKPGSTNNCVPQTWAMKVDAAKVDAAQTEKLAAAGGAEQFLYPLPRSFDERAGDMAANARQQEAWIAALKPNTWAARGMPKNHVRYGQNRGAFGSAAFDAGRQTILHWGGGHVAHVGNSVLHYSLRTGCCYTGFPDETAIYGHVGIGMPVYFTYKGRPYMDGHSSHHFDYDPTIGKMVSYGGDYYGGKGPHEAYWYFYDPYVGDWEPPALRDPASTCYEQPKVFCRGTPEGIFLWDAGCLWRLDYAGKQWKKIPVTGGKLRHPGGLNGDGMCYEAKRKRFLFFYGSPGSGQVDEVDPATGQLRSLSPAGMDGDLNSKDGHKREAFYIAKSDAVFVGGDRKSADGKLWWPVYDCAKNAWYGVRLGGEDPLKSSAGSHSLALVYDEKRGVIWAVGGSSQISACKLDLDAAEKKPFAEMK